MFCRSESRRADNPGLNQPLSRALTYLSPHKLLDSPTIDSDALKGCRRSECDDIKGEFSNAFYTTPQRSLGYQYVP